jgi:beta-lactamase class A
LQRPDVVHGLSRRSLLAAAVLLPLTACAPTQTLRPSSSTTPTPNATATTVDGSVAFAALEQTFDARLGVWAFDTGSNTLVGYRSAERFAFCSTSKPLAIAALLSRRPARYLDTLVRFTQADILSYAPITSQRVATGMTVRELCDAAIRYSDNTAENLILREVGGPAEVTAYVRGLGDEVTRFDRLEPTLNTAIPGDARDTTSPHAIGLDLQKLLLGTALRADTRAALKDWMLRNTTSTVPALSHIRAGVPAGWTVADKTGNGSYGSINDIAVIWPPNRAPIVAAVLSTRPQAGDSANSALITEATRVLVGLLPGQ